MTKDSEHDVPNSRDSDQFPSELLSSLQLGHSKGHLPIDTPKQIIHDLREHLIHKHQQSDERDIMDVENAYEEFLQSELISHKSKKSEVNLDRLFSRSGTSSDAHLSEGAREEFRERGTTECEIEEERTALRQFDQEFDLQRWIQLFLRSLSRTGIKLRITGVSFKNLTVTGINSGFTFQENFLQFLATPFRIIENVRNLKNKPKTEIISDFTGLVRSGEMLLVLGRPGAGCSTFLKSISGNHKEYHAVEGDILYNGISQEYMMKHFRGEISYCQEVDVHFPTLTVGQTLEFAARTRTPQTRPNNISRSDYVKVVRDLFCTVLGLRHTLRTKVGNDYVRGVSGGERKRVSIAENFITRSTVQCWDNSTRGLDASTALEYTRSLRIMTNLAGTTCLVAIYQAGQNIYDLFDRVTVLYKGKQIYFGPADKAEEYFTNMGWERAPRQTVSDFLTTVTDPLARKPRSGYENKVPKTEDEFENYWKESPEYERLLDELRAYEQDYPRMHDDQRQKEQFFASTKQEKSRHVKHKSPYTISYWMQIRYCTIRAYQRMLGNIPYYAANIFAAFFQSLIIGSIFYGSKNDTNSFFSRGGVIFYAILYQALSSMAEITNMYEQRPIIAKHQNYAMYHASADALSLILVDIPFKLLITIVFDIILYFLSGLQRSAGQFFTFFLFTFLTTLTMTSFFRLLATVTKNAAQALTLAGIGVLALTVYTGYLIPTRDTGWWLRWLSYINPIQYTFEALMVNEFKSINANCATVVPSGGAYDALPFANKVCAVTGSQPGQALVNGLDYLRQSYGYEKIHLWRNFGILVGFMAFFTAANVLGSEFISPVKTRGEVLVFRRGHAPKQVQKAITENKAVDVDLEKPVEQRANNENFAQEKNGSEKDAKARNNGSSDFKAKNSDDRKSSPELVKPKDIFTFRGITLDIKIGDEKRRLLDDVQGYVKPGTLTALMGESGAGKTTLLNALAQRIDIGVLTGDMMVNGTHVGKTFQRSTGYVQQQDVHKQSATVREALQFSALLRQPKSTPKKEKLEYVEKVIELLEMQEFSEAIVGEPGEGLNVEQRKRLTIGVELAAKPTLLLFLDEPTSGLDSQSAWSIVSFLRKLADSGQAILCTIHQPSAILFQQFDRLLLLKKGGQTVYFGDIGENSTTLLNYFEANGARKCGPEENPAEVILDYIGAGATAHVDQDWAQTWKNSPQYKQTEKEIEEIHAETKNQKMEILGDPNSSFAMPVKDQILIVTKREFQSFWRDVNYLRSKFALNVVAGLFLGFTFYKANNTVQGLQNKLFAVFMAVVLSVSLVHQLQPRFFESRALYEVRERPSKMYSWIAFIASQVICEIPFNIFSGTLFFLSWYFAIGYFKSSSNQAFLGAITWMFYMLFQLYFVSFGQALAAASPNEQVASVLVTIFFTFVLSFCGVLQPKDLLPGFWLFMYYASPYTYLIGGMLSSLLHGVQVRCASEEFNLLQPPAGQTCQSYLSAFLSATNTYVTNPDATDSCQFCRYSVGDSYLSTVNIFYSQKWRNYGILWGYVTFNFAMVFVLHYLFRESSLLSTIYGRVWFLFTKLTNRRNEKIKSNKEAEPRSSSPRPEDKTDNAHSSVNNPQSNMKTTGVTGGMSAAY